MKAKRTNRASARAKREPAAHTGPAPRMGGPTEEFVVERASASPVRAVTAKREGRSQKPEASMTRAQPARQARAGDPRRLRGHARTSSGRQPQRRLEGPKAPRSQEPATSSPLAPPLARAQRWFLDVISHPRGVSDAVDDRALMRGAGAAGADELERLVTPGPRLSARERLGIYHYAYHARLIDCLADDFPAVRHALGETAFDALCRAVILERPSDGPNLNFYGRRLAEHCAAPRARVANRAFVAELAALEWALVEVFHAHAAPTFSAEALRAIPPERWAAARLRPSQTVRVLEFAYPVNRFFQDFRNEREPAIPRRAWSATAVYRIGFRLWRMDLTRPMAGLLARLFAGEPLAKALESLGEGDEAMAKDVMRWFSEWVSGGFFAELGS